MLPHLTLVRPEASTQDVGTDGLTDHERSVYAADYNATIARKTLKAVEKDVIERWLASRGSEEPLLVRSCA